MKTEWIPWAKPKYWGKESQYVSEALASTWISGGPFVDQLERGFKERVRCGYAAAVSNGTAALHAAFLALGVLPNDEIVVPGFAFMAAANVALHVRARPVFAEVDPGTWCLNLETIEPCVSPKTRAIVTVHTYGNVCDMGPILDFAAARGIPVIEDAAEAFGSRYKGSHAGTIGRIGTYSFQATKSIATGEGGMVVTDDEQLYSNVCLYRSHGMSERRYWHEVVGHNFRLTNLQAALGCAQLEYVEEIFKDRRRIHSIYRELLSDIPEISLQEFRPSVDPVLWAIAVRLDSKAFPQGRDQVMEQLATESIETRPGFYAASQMKIYQCPTLPTCESISRQVISLPTFPEISSEQISYICQTLRSLRR